MFIRLCENEFNVAGIERTEEYLGLSVGLCAGAKSELIDGYASGLDYVREHKTISLLLLLQLKVRTEKILLS